MKAECSSLNRSVASQFADESGSFSSTTLRTLSAISHSSPACSTQTSCLPTSPCPPPPSHAPTQSARMLHTLLYTIFTPYAFQAFSTNSVRPMSLVLNS